MGEKKRKTKQRYSPPRGGSGGWGGGGGGKNFCFLGFFCFAGGGGGRCFLPPQICLAHLCCCVEPGAFFISYAPQKKATEDIAEKRRHSRQKKAADGEGGGPPSRFAIPRRSGQGPQRVGGGKSFRASLARHRKPIVFVGPDFPPHPVPPQKNNAFFTRTNPARRYAKRKLCRLTRWEIWAFFFPPGKKKIKEEKDRKETTKKNRPLGGCRGHEGKVAGGKNKQKIFFFFPPPKKGGRGGGGEKKTGGGGDAPPPPGGGGEKILPFVLAQGGARQKKNVEAFCFKKTKGPGRGKLRCLGGGDCFGGENSTKMGPGPPPKKKTCVCPFVQGFFVGLKKKEELLDFRPSPHPNATGPIRGLSKKGRKKKKKLFPQTKKKKKRSPK